LSDEEEEQLYNVVLELWPIGEMALEELYFKKKNQLWHVSIRRKT
jgi:hypothetical protein